MTKELSPRLAEFFCNAVIFSCAIVAAFVLVIMGVIRGYVWDCEDKKEIARLQAEPDKLKGQAHG